MVRRNKGIQMKFLKVVLLAAMAMTLFTGCSYVKQGEVGVVINKFGDDKGIVTEEKTQGYTFLGIRKDMVKFPTYKQNYVWTKSPAEGSENDEAIYFNTKDGMAVDVDIGITYAIVPSKADEIFAEYRMGVEEITDQYLRNKVRDVINVLSSDYTCEDVYGEKKGEFFGNVESNVIVWGESKGLVIEDVYLIGRPRLPPQVESAINAKIAATQKAQMRENEIQEATADAQKKREAAAGEADAYTLNEEAKLDIMERQAAILKENPALVQWKALEIWDGVLPKFTGGGAVPFINVDAPAK
jgi:regulator of protease activity HflC (stomatin/prohibitin superfamily)